MAVSPGTRTLHIAAVTAAGAGLVLVALMLYATELSRATGVAIMPFALCLFGAAIFARARDHWPSRSWLIAFGILVLAGLLYGLWLYIDGLMHPPMPS